MTDATSRERWKRVRAVLEGAIELDGEMRRRLHQGHTISEGYAIVLVLEVARPNAGTFDQRLSISTA